MIVLKKYVLSGILILGWAGCELLSDDGAEFEFGQAVIATAGGGYLVVGSAPHGGDHVATLRAFDRRDGFRWRRNLMASAHHMLAQDVVALEDGGFMVAGYTYGSGDAYDPTSFAVLRTNQEGHLQWHKVYGGDRDELYDVLLTGGQQLVVSGKAGGLPWSYGDEKGYWALLDLDGTPSWERTDSAFFPVEIIEAHGDGYVAISNAGTHLVRLRPDGTIVWRKRLEQAGGVGFVLSGNGDGAIVRHGDGYVIVGSSTDAQFQPQLLVLKVDADGEVGWSKVLHRAVGVDAVVMDGKDILVAGVEVTEDPESTPSIRHLPYVTLIDGAGEQRWERTYPCSPSSFPVSLARLSDGGAVFAGSFRDGPGDSHVLRIRIATNGDVSYAECR